MDRRKVTLIFVALALALVGCAALQKSPPIFAQEEYEHMLAGRTDANYVGTNTCLAACHVHDKMRTDFDASTMGAQLSAKTGMPTVDCESCHGPGSLAIAGITPERVAEDAKSGVITACNYETLIDLKNLPTPAKSLLCLKCHTSNATFNLHNWNAGTHSMNEVTCVNCHNIHQGPDLKVSPRDTFAMCTNCHQTQKAQFYMPSRHAVVEQKIYCIDCHNPHGTLSDLQLRKETVKETCAQCHADKEGPYTFEHADLTENCSNCHVAHGSPNENMLQVAMPFLCMQCHEPHGIANGETNRNNWRDVNSNGTYDNPPDTLNVITPTNAANADKHNMAGNRNVYTRCTNCHSMIHGTDTPGPGNNMYRLVQ